MSAPHPEYVGVYCPTCKQDCVPLPNGTCGFYDTLVANRDGTPLGKDKPVVRPAWDPAPTLAAPSPLRALETKLEEQQHDPSDNGRRQWSTAPWTHDLIIEALQEWKHAHGEFPYASEWRAAGEGRPTEQTVRTRFGSWEAAIESASLVSETPDSDTKTPPSDTTTLPPAAEPVEDAPDERRWAHAFDWTPWDVDVAAGENPGVFDAGFLFDEAKDDAKRAVAKARAALARLALAQEMFRELADQFDREATEILEDTSLSDNIAGARAQGAAGWASGETA